MISAIVFIVLGIVIFHFVYDGIILPSLRLHLRLKLFELRDELRLLKICEKDSLNNPAFSLIHDGINLYLNRLPLLNIVTTRKLIASLHNDKNIQKHVNERLEVIESCSDDRLKEIFHKANNILEAAFIANSGGWFIYLVPIAVCTLSIKKISKLAVDLVVLPANYVNRLIPDKAVA